MVEWLRKVRACVGGQANSHEDVQKIGWRGGQASPFSSKPVITNKLDVAKKMNGLNDVACINCMLDLEMILFREDFPELAAVKGEW